MKRRGKTHKIAKRSRIDKLNIKIQRIRFSNAAQAQSHARTRWRIFDRLPHRDSQRPPQSTEYVGAAVGDGESHAQFGRSGTFDFRLPIDVGRGP